MRGVSFPISRRMRQDRRKTAAIAVATLLLALSGCGSHTNTTFTTTPPPAQNLKTLATQPPDGAGVGFLLTDGSVVFQGDKSFDWFKLTPDQSGSYAKGTWSQIASLPAGYVPEDFASSVLADGRLVILGGEYINSNFVLSNLGAIYDPVANAWMSLAAPTGWDYIRDSPSVVLPDGQFLVGRKVYMLMAALDPITLRWTAMASTGKSDFNAEEGWTLLPDGSVLTFDVKNAPNSERYIPSLAMWVTAGKTKIDLHSPTNVSGGLTYGGASYFPPAAVTPPVLPPHVQLSSP